MRKTLLFIFAVVLLISTVTGLVSCVSDVEFKVNFVVDEEVYATVNTSGMETIRIPDNPTKEDYTFDGWYWDKETWQKPFTANSLLDAPLSSDMNVYAKWVETNPPCQHRDADDNSLCDVCGEAYNDGDEPVVTPTYTITFITNGGTAVAPITTDVINESPVTTRDYNTFVAWYTDESLQESTRVSFPFTPSSNVTLYAKWSVDFTEGLQFTLQASTNTYSVTGYTGTESTVVIPATYKGLDVTAINTRAFAGNSTITEVTIPNSVISIGLGAFSECYNLVSVDMSEQLQLLGASAFSNCIKLETVDLPDTLQNIGGEAFFGCTALKELYLSNELTNIGTNIIRGCSSLEKLTLPGRITLISLVGDALANIPATLTTISFANGSQSICENALYSCTQIENINIPNTVTSIEANAFFGCTGIADIVLPESIVSVALGAFNGCASLTNITVPFVGATKNGTTNTHFGYIFGASNYSENSDYVPASLRTVTITGGTSVDSNAFYGCDGIVNIDIGDGVTTLSTNAFFGCTGLRAIRLSSSVTSIKNLAFDGCTGLEEVRINNLRDWFNVSFESVHANPLYYAGNLYVNESLLVNLVIPSEITEIGDYTFAGCTSITNATVHEDVIKMGNASFYGCSSLLEITLPFLGYKANETTNVHIGYIFGASGYLENGAFLPESLKTVTITKNPIAQHSFYGCTYISTIVIPENTKIIPLGAFANCTSLVSINIPDSVEYIDNYAFRGCEALESVNIPDGITWINESVFENCKNLVDVTLPESVSYISKNAFRGCRSLKSISFPSTLQSIGENAFYDCLAIENITVPNSVLSIGLGAFGGCSFMESITLPFIGGSTRLQNTTYLGYIFGAEVAQDNPDYVPTTLKSVTVTGGENIPHYAFFLCSSIETVKITCEISSIGAHSFECCEALVNFDIPESVSSIGAYAFANCISIVKLTIPDGIETLDDYVFCRCTSLENINIPTSVTKIGPKAFAECQRLTSITIPNGVREIGDGAFSLCEGISEITVPSSVEIIGSSAFALCSSLRTLTIPFVGKTADAVSNESVFGYIFGASRYSDNSTRVPESLETVTITGGTRIMSRAFSNCLNLVNVNMPNTVLLLGDYVFENCESLSSVAISEGLESLSYGMFSNCVSLEDVTIPDNVTKICSYTFVGCTGLASLPNLNNVSEIEEYAFSGCTGIKKIENLAKVSKIGPCVFFNCTGIKSVSLSDYVTNIGHSIFYGCSSIEEMSIPFIGQDGNGTANTHLGYLFGAAAYSNNKTYVPTSLKTLVITSCSKIPNYSLYECSSLENVTFPDSVTAIGDSALAYCSSLIKIDFPSQVSTISANAFNGCTRLKEIEVPESVISIGRGAFGYCTSLEKITLPFIGAEKYGRVNTHFSYIFGAHSYGYSSSTVPTSLKSVTVSYGRVEAYAFYSCGKIKDITILSGDGSVGEQAFAYCGSLVSLDIADGITAVGNSAFYSCRMLESIEISENIQAVGESAFDDCYALTFELYGDAYYLGNEANPYLILMKAKDTSISEFNFNANTRYIYSNAFSGCSSIKEIYIPSSVRGIGKGAFKACSMLEKITVPFIGERIDASTTNFFAYIFGSDGYRDNTSVPLTLKEVVVTNANRIADGAFYGCNRIETFDLPDTITSIGDYAFYACQGLSSIPSGVQTIGSYAFQYSESLSNLVIPNSVVAIGIGAFANCSNIESITVPFVGASVSGTTDNHFGYIFGATTYSENNSYIPELLKSVTVNGSNIPNYAFYGCANVTSVNLGANIESIGTYAFSGCTRVASVNLGANVKSIGTYAFNGCTSISRISIPASLESIGINAFKNCTDLIGVDITSLSAWCNISFANNYANPLSYAKKLYLNGELVTRMEIPSGITKIGNYAFYNGTEITYAIIPEGVTSIGWSAFEGCVNMTRVDFSETVLDIDSCAFKNCTKLSWSNLSNSIETIGGEAFYNCPGGLMLTFGNNLKRIGQDAFKNSPILSLHISDISVWCNVSFGNEYANPMYMASSVHEEDGSLLNSQLTIPQGVTQIGAYAFVGIDGITHVYIPESVESIGDYAFAWCSNLVVVAMSEGLKEIGAYAFSSCTKVTELTIPSGVETIGDSAFSNWRGLTKIVVPDSVSKIGKGAFENCSSLQEITLPFVGMSKNGTTNTHFGYIFGASTYSNNSTSVPATLQTVTITAATNIAPYAFQACSRIESITLPDSITSIGAYAFRNCTYLTSVSLGVGEGWWYSTNANATSGYAVSEAIISSSASFANYLKTYASYYLKR